MVFMDEELRSELLRRVAADQEARHALDAGAMAAADGENLPWLRQVISDVGWPGRSLVGGDGAHAAWLLAQHADSDPAFQGEQESCHQVPSESSPLCTPGSVRAQVLAGDGVLRDEVVKAGHAGFSFLLPGCRAGMTRAVPDL